MLEISDLGLTIFQLNEVNDADPAVVAAWLDAAAAPEIRSPTGFFLKGLRTGQIPQGSSDERVHLVSNAERWMERVGCLYPDAEMALAELFDRAGLLRHHGEDLELRERMAASWRQHRPLGEQVEQEFLARNRPKGARA